MQDQQYTKTEVEESRSSSSSEEESSQSQELPPLDTIEDIDSFEKLGKLPASLTHLSGGKIVQVKSALFLCNTHSGSGRGKKVCRKAIRLLRAKGIKVKRIYLERAGHAEEICRTMDLSSYDVVGCVGGDGTFHEAANGILKSQNSKKIPLAFVPAGTGNSFALELGIGTNITRAVDHILRGIVCPVDAIQLHFDDSDKEDIFSLNSIHWGLASAVNVKAERLRWMGHALRYTTAALYECVKGEKRSAKIELEFEDGSTKCYDDGFCLLIANNIQGACKGMTIAPEARINDGLIDLLLIRTTSKQDLFAIFRKIHTASHTDLDSVQYEKVKRFSVLPYDRNDDEIEELVDVDGELTGITPFSARVLPGALNLVI